MAIVDVWLTGGQSNMSGTSGADGKDTHPDTDPDTCWEWDGGPGLVQVDDNVSCGGDYKAQTGSMLPAFVKDIVQATGRPSVIVRAAVGGTALLAPNATANGHWSTTGQLFANSVTRANDAIADIIALGHTIGRVNVVWSQGHKDATEGNNLEEYEAATAALVTRWRNGLSQPTLKVYMELLSSTSANSSSGDPEPNWQLVRDAQLAACESTEGLDMAFTEGTDYANRPGWLKNDNLHYKQVGLDYMGQRFAEYIANDLGLAPPPAEVNRSPTSAAARLLLPADPVYGSPTWITAGSFTWSVPGGITSIGGEAIGAGGGGGGSDSLFNNGGGGGGAAYTADPTISVTPFEELTIVVGAGGSGGLGGAGGSAGGASGIKRGGTWLLKADGGVNGLNVSPYTGGSAGLAVNCIGETTTSGTNGGLGGNGGSIGHGGAAASGGTLTGGAGGTANTNTSSSAADAGDAPGGGGAGKRNTTGTGGAGARGIVKITL